MSTSAGAAGAFGILLMERSEVSGLRAQINDLINGLQDENQADEDQTYDDLNLDPDDKPEIKAFTPLLITAFRNAGIEVPDEAELFWTGWEHDRPANCSTPAEEFVLGFGLFTDPWDFPEMHQSFRDIARWHTWVWMG